MSAFKNMNLPNKLTIIRIIMVPLFMVSMMLTKNMQSEMIKLSLSIVSALLFLAAAVTDFIDGKIARKHNLVTSFGKFMDPLADKFMVIGALMAAIYVYDNLRLWLVIATAITVFRELAVSGIRLVAVTGENVVIAAAMPGKIKTFSQCIFVELLILEPIIFSTLGLDMLALYTPLTYVCMAVMVFFTIYSGMQYILAYKKYITI
ncbi:MAG: CDP-diacylglycerol--glycerol-3-phosphate 3-phosphatidyltransferase [Clostridia bacterium]|nr:CDP-diacylglycerol--glycerol-3-phosphate 3-phosphatidyltransferase [Clostridia bacterium]